MTQYNQSKRRILLAGSAVLALVTACESINDPAPNTRAGVAAPDIMVPKRPNTQTETSLGEFVVPPAPNANPRDTRTSYIPDISEADLRIEGVDEPLSSPAYAHEEVVKFEQLPQSEEIFVTGHKKQPTPVAPQNAVFADFNNAEVYISEPDNAPFASVSSTYESRVSSDNGQYVTADGKPYPKLDTEGIPIIEGGALWGAGSGGSSRSTSSSSYTASSSGSYALHLASYQTNASMRAGWSALQRQYSGALSGLTPIYSSAVVNGANYLRLKAGPFASRSQASQACATLKANGGYCAVMSFDGNSF